MSASTHAMDIRVPMGTMFSLLGFVLAGYGVISYGSERYSRSLGINVNLWWGLVILAFGLIMLLLSYRASRGNTPPAPAEPIRLDPTLPLTPAV